MDDNKKKEEGTGNPSKTNPKGNTNKGFTKRRNFNNSKERNLTPWKNDWSYYAISEEIAKEIANLPYNRIPGTTWNLSGTSGTESYGKDCSFPGIMKIRVSTAIGKADIATEAGTSAINMAAKQLYAMVRKSNSGAKNYEPSDLMMYILQMRDVYKLYLELRRTLRLAHSFSAVNRYYPKAIIKSMNINWEDLVANYSGYKAQVNILAAKINSFSIPNYFKVFQRDAYISNEIFMDSTSPRGQIYFFELGAFYNWNATSSERGTELISVGIANPNTASGTNFQNYVDRLELLLNTLFLDTDINTMNGDIMKAFPDSQFYSVPEVGDEPLTPVFDEDILAQVENLAYFGSVTLTHNSTISQQDGIIVSSSPYQAAIPSMMQSGLMSDIILNSHKDQPDFRDNLEWTRMMNPVKYWLEGKSTIKHDYAIGLELVLGCYIYILIPGSETLDMLRFSSACTASNKQVEELVHLSQFDWHPLVYHLDDYEPTVVTTGHSIAVSGDLKVATVVTFDTIKKLHDSAVYAAFYSPSMRTQTQR